MLSKIKGNEFISLLKEKLVSMRIKDFGFVMKAKFDDNPNMHAVHMTHDGKNVIIHDYA